MEYFYSYAKWTVISNYNHTKPMKQSKKNLYQSAVNNSKRGRNSEKKKRTIKVNVSITFYLVEGYLTTEIPQIDL